MVDFLSCASIALLLRGAKIFLGGRFLWVSFGRFLCSGGFQDERAAVSEVNFCGLPSLVWALVPEFQGIGGCDGDASVGKVEPGEDSRPTFLRMPLGLGVECVPTVPSRE
jgi:hypothetical protein